MWCRCFWQDTAEKSGTLFGVTIYRTVIDTDAHFVIAAVITAAAAAAAGDSPFSLLNHGALWVFMSMPINPSTSKPRGPNCNCRVILPLQEETQLNSWLDLSHLIHSITKKEGGGVVLILKWPMDNQTTSWLNQKQKKRGNTNARMTAEWCSPLGKTEALHIFFLPFCFFHSPSLVKNTYFLHQHPNAMTESSLGFVLISHIYLLSPG